MKRIYLIPLAFVLLMVFIALPALAEIDETGNDMSLVEEFFAESDLDAAIGPDFGTQDRHGVATYSGSCTPIRSTYTYSQNYGWRWSTTGSWSWFDCSANIPQGAKMILVGVEAYDNDPSSNVILWFIEADWLSSQYTDYPAAGVSTSGASTSRQYLWADLQASNITIDHAYNSYGARIRVGGDSGTQFRSVWFVYKLQISPAPGTATFNDVGTGHWAFREIEALCDSGITVGCGGGNYCPNNYVTRAQMAVFLARALGLHW
jgi:hypothetical protein